MKFCYKNDILDWRIVILAFFLCLLHILTVKILIIASVIAICEAAILLFLALKCRFDLYLYVLVIILATTLEFPIFIDESLKYIPSITMLPFVKGYFFLLLSLWPLPKLLYNRSVWKSIPFKSLFFYVSIFASSTLIIGIVMWILSMFMNGTSTIFHFSFLIKDLISLGLFSVYALYFIYAYLHYPGFKRYLELITFSVLVAVILVALFVSLIGVRGYYGSNEIVLMPLSFFFSTSIIFFLFYKKYRKKHIILLLFLSLAAIFMQLVYSNALSGKSWLVTFAILLICLALLYNRAKLKFVGGLIILAFSFPFLLNIIEEQTDSDSLTSSKLTQALSLISVVDIDWYDNLPLSPKIRIEEFFNTNLEYIEHPSFMLLGKGFGGGHQDYRCSYGNYNPAAFSLEEYNNEYFIMLHESLNTVFLKFGILGLIFWGFLLLKFCSNFNKSPWLILGGLWFLFFWGYSPALMSIGLSSLIIGMGDVQCVKLENEICDAHELE